MEEEEGEAGQGEGEDTVTTAAMMDISGWTGGKVTREGFDEFASQLQDANGN